MRKKWEDEIRKLNDEIELLEKKLDIKSDALFEHQKLIYFLSEHDRTDVEIVSIGGAIYTFDSWRRFGDEYTNTIEVRYIWGKELKEIKIDTRICHKIELISNDKMRIVIKATNEENTEQFVYYRITKCSGEVADVSEYYPKEEPTTVAKPDTPTETDFKYFTAEQVRNMSQKEVRENYSDIMKSMEKWGEENGNS